jgi:hypothetical protein
MLMFDLSDEAKQWVSLNSKFVGSSPAARALMGFDVCDGLFYAHAGSGGEGAWSLLTPLLLCSRNCDVCV